MRTLKLIGVILISFLTYTGINSQTILFSSDFESPDYLLGDITGQQGWTTSTSNWNISDSNPNQGSQHLLLEIDNANTTIAFTPILPAMSYASNFSTSTAMISIPNGSSGSVEFIPQNPSIGSVNTRVRFNEDRSIDVLDAAASDFQSSGFSIPLDYVQFTVIVNRTTLAMQVYLNSQLIYQGMAFAPDIEQIVFLRNEVIGSTTLSIDDVFIYDGLVLPTGSIGIPTLSQWGMIILSLLLLIFGVIHLNQALSRFKYFASE